MPVQVDTPNGIGSPNDWGLWGSAPDKVSAVQTSDGDNAVIYGFSKGRDVIQLYTFSPILGVADPVTAASISAFGRLYEQGNATRGFYMQWNGARAGSDQTSSLPVGGPYTTLSYSAGAATLAAVNGQHGVEMFAVSGTGCEVWVTWVARSVTFVFAGGSAGSADTQFAHLIGSIAACIGANLLLREMPRLNRALGRVKLLPEEYETAWKAWKAYKHPVWSV